MIRAVLSDWGHTLFDTAGSVGFLERWAADRGLSATPGRRSSLYHSAFARSRSADELAQGRDTSAERHRRCWLSLWAELDRELPGAAEALYAIETSAEGQLFRLALESLGLPPDEVLMVGDNPSNDGHAVLHGIRTLLLPLPQWGAPRGLADVIKLL